MKKDFDALPALEKIFIFEKGSLAYVDRTRYIPEVYRFCPEPAAPTLMDEAGAEPTDDVGEVIVRQVLCARYHSDTGIRQFYFVVKDGVMPGAGSGFGTDPYGDEPQHTGDLCALLFRVLEDGRLPQRQRRDPPVLPHPAG